MTTPKRETKSSPFIWTAKSLSERDGVIEAIVALFGVVDGDLDVIELGAFRKAVASHVSVVGSDGKTTIGKVLSLKEIGRADLPEKVRADYPRATGGLSAKLQMFAHVAEGKTAFLQMGMWKVKEFRLHLLPTGEDYRHVQHKGKKTGVRILTGVDLRALQPLLAAPAKPKKSAITPIKRARKLAEIYRLQSELEATIKQLKRR